LERVDGVVFDITERKEAEKERELLEFLIESVDDAIVGTTLDGIIVSWNSGAQRIFGYEFKEMVGKSLSILVPPEIQNDIPKIFDRIRHGEKIDHYHTKRVRKDQSRIDISVTVSPIKDGEGNIIGASAIASDLTEIEKVKYQRARELRKSIEQTRNLLEFQNKVIDTALVWINLLDAEGNVTLWNHAAELISGYSRQEVIGHKGVWKWLYPDPQYCASCFARAKNIIDGKPEGNFETQIRSKDGESKVISWYTNSITDEKRKPVGSIAIGLDISDLKKAEGKLQQATARLLVMNEKLLVVGGLTRHDVRNKLSAIIGNTYLARKKLPENSAASDNLQQVDESVQQTERILEFAKAYEMLGLKQLTYVDVEESINEAISLFSNLKDIKITNECHGLTVLADSVLRTLFYNLIDDSLKHAKKLGEIRVYYQEKNDRLELIYEDDGVGISDAVKSKLFSRDCTMGQGFGHALFLANKMMDVYGWRMQEIGEPGKGVKFVITIPKNMLKS